MAGGQQPDNSFHAAAIGWVMALVVLYALSMLFWYYNHVMVRDLVRWWRLYQMMGISYFVGLDYIVEFNGKSYSYGQIIEYFKKFPAEKLNYKTLAFLSEASMGVVRQTIIFILGAFSVWSLVLGPNTQYRGRMGLEALIEFQSRNFPVIYPFRRFNPSKQPPRPPGAPVPAELPLFAEALGPEEWISYNSIPVPDGKLDEGAAYEAFVRQLGQPWKGVDGLEPYKKILLASFCLKASRKRGEADQMLGRAARCWSAEEGFDLRRDKKLLAEARAILSNKDLSAKVLGIANQHAFETTAFLRALAQARADGGVLAPAQFVWLRGHDRVLWYPMNNLGRQAFHMEALGAMAHYKAEKMTSRPIPVPKVELAMDTIRAYMRSAKARPIPPLDYSRSKNKGVKKPV